MHGWLCQREGEAGEVCVLLGDRDRTVTVIVIAMMGVVHLQGCRFSISHHITSKHRFVYAEAQHIELSRYARTVQYRTEIQYSIFLSANFVDVVVVSCMLLSLTGLGPSSIVMRIPSCRLWRESTVDGFCTVLSGCTVEYMSGYLSVFLVIHNICSWIL